MTLEERVTSAAEATLEYQKYVSAVDVLTRIGFLAPTHVESWRQGRLSYLEEAIQANPNKISAALQIFQQWARSRGLLPAETEYLARTIGAAKTLQFTASADPAREAIYRTHYVSPQLSEKKRENLREKLSSAPEIVIFEIIRDSECSQCKREIMRGDFLVMEGGQPLCMTCADLDHLVFLPRGDVALTRRARKYSKLSAVVVRFSRARKRYERQGLLVQEAALEKAEEECLEDEEVRVLRRDRDAARRADQDRELAHAMAAKIRELFPGCPERETAAIAEHTSIRGSGRVGRSAAGRALEDDAVRAAVIASVRHNHTNYDELLMQGSERSFARDKVRDQVDEVLEKWERPLTAPPA